MTEVVATENVVVLVPAGTVTGEGTVAKVWLLLTTTAIPPVGALPVSVIVPVEEPPLITVEGLSVRILGTGGVTVKVAVLAPPAFPVTTTVIEAATGTVVTVNVAVVLPAVTVTEAGTEATAVLPDVNVTDNPPVGAAPVNVTVPVEETPPRTLDGFRVTVLRIGGVTVKVPALDEPPVEAVTLTAVEAATGVVVAVNDAVVLPATTVTEVGMLTAVALPLFRVTTRPPVGAALVKVTVPVEETPPCTLDGLNDKAEIIGVTVKVADFVTPPAAAEIVTLVEVETPLVLMEKVAVVLLAATRTEAGTVATAVLADVNVTAKPPEGALPVSVTVPVDVLLPKTLVGLTLKALAAAAAMVRVADLVTPPAVAEMREVAFVTVGNVVTVNSTKLAAAGTVTEAGTVATVVLPLLKVTMVPPVGAALLSVIRPTLLTLPATVEGVSVNTEAVCAKAAVLKVDKANRENTKARRSRGKVATKSVAD